MKVQLPTDETVEVNSETAHAVELFRELRRVEVKVDAANRLLYDHLYRNDAIDTQAYARITTAIDDAVERVLAESRERQLAASTVQTKLRDALRIGQT